jgi:hypothetical protein
MKSKPSPKSEAEKFAQMKLFDMLMMDDKDKVEIQPDKPPARRIGKGRRRIKDDTYTRTE